MGGPTGTAAQDKLDVEEPSAHGEEERRQRQLKGEELLRTEWREKAKAKAAGAATSAGKEKKAKGKGDVTIAVLGGSDVGGGGAVDTTQEPPKKAEAPEAAEAEAVDEGGDPYAASGSTWGAHGYY